MPRDAGDLDVVHRQHHAAGSAALRERRTQFSQLAHAAAQPPQFPWHGRRQRLDFTQRRQALSGEAAAGIDIRRVFGRYADREPLDRGQQSREFFARSGTHGRCRCLVGDWGQNRAPCGTALAFRKFTGPVLSPPIRFSENPILHHTTNGRRKRRAERHTAGESRALHQGHPGYPGAGVGDKFMQLFAC